MSPKAVASAAVAIAAVLALAAVLPCASAGSASTYEDQLDDNGAGLYAALGEAFDAALEDPADTVTVSYALGTPVLLSTEDDADEYAVSLVRDALAAYYLTDPFPIWIWDFPLVDDLEAELELAYTQTEAEVTVSGETTTWRVVTAVTFTLTVPEDFADDADTEENEVAEAIEAVESAASAYEGTVQEIVQEVSGLLEDVDSEDDEDGEVSNLYDALVSGESSSAGVAAAFTYLCSLSGVDALTTVGLVLNSDGEMEAGYWNVVEDDGAWYAVDCTWNSSDSENCLMAGTTTSVTLSSTSYGFGATHASDLSSLSSSLSTPAIEAEGVDWDEDSSFTTIAMYVIVLLIIVMVVIAFAHAIKSGNV